MLKGNLSTRPFYNERVVALVLTVLGLAAIALTVFNVQQVRSLSRERAGLRTEIVQKEAEARRIRAEADAIQQGIDRTALQTLLVATREANSLIEQRAFSWTVFFDYIESTLPIDVRLVSVQPRVERGQVIVAMLVITRAPRHLKEFVDNLGATRAFENVFVTGQQQNDDGTFGATIETLYAPPARTPAGEERPAAPGGGGQP